MTGPHVLSGAALNAEIGGLHDWKTVAAAQVGQNETTAIPGIQVAIAGIDSTAADRTIAVPTNTGGMNLG